MKKKLVITLALLLAVGCSFGISAMITPKAPSQYNIGIDYNDAVKSEKPMLIVFYVDWCGYCLKFMPKFNILNKLYADKFNFVMLNVEASEYNKMLAKRVGIAGYPTVYILDPKYDNKVLMPNSIYQELGAFRVELDRYLRIRSLLDSK